MVYFGAHKADKIDWRYIIALSLSVLPVICAARIADAPLEPVFLLISLHLDDEHRPGRIRAHEVKLKILVVVHDRTLVLGRQIADIHHASVFRQEGIDYRHDHILVCHIAEQRLESSVR